MPRFQDQNMSPTPSAVLFDLDGTLVDSARDLSAALNHVLRKAARPEMEIDRVRHMVGDGARALILKGFSDSGAVPGNADIKAILDDFLDYYLENIAERTIIFPGARQVIEDLAAREIPLGLCTNKALRLSEKLMTEMGLAKYFSAIVGGDSFPYCKPDPRHLTATLEKMTAAPERAVMVGDSANDIIAAQKAHMPVIGVSFGYTKTPLAELNPDIIIDHFDDFPMALEKICERF